MPLCESGKTGFLEIFSAQGRKQEHQYSTILLTIKFSQGKIESETWAGIAKAEEVLEDKFHDIDDNTKNQRGKTKKKTEKQKHSTTAVKTSKIPAMPVG